MECIKTDQIASMQNPDDDLPIDIFFQSISFRKRPDPEWRMRRCVDRSAALHARTTGDPGNEPRAAGAVRKAHLCGSSSGQTDDPMRGNLRNDPGPDVQPADERRVPGDP